MNACEIDLGRHTVINILTDDEERTASGTEKLQELLTLVNEENESLLKQIMKICICSKNGAEYILDELIDKMDKAHPESYFIEKAGLSEFLENEGYDLD